MVVLEVGREDDVDIDAVPAALRARLGHDATAGLLDLLDLSHQEARDAVITACTERFERRVVAEVSGLRVDMAKMESGLRQDMAKLEASLRQEMAGLGASLRQEMASLGASLRQEMAGLGSSLRGDIAAGRVELFKWCFLFWIGQVLAIGSLMAVMLRVIR